MSPQARRRRTPRTPTLAAIHELLDAGLNISQAARALRCSQPNITQRLRRERDPVAEHIRDKAWTDIKRERARAQKSGGDKSPQARAADLIVTHAPTTTTPAAPIATPASGPEVTR